MDQEMADDAMIAATDAELSAIDRIEQQLHDFGGQLEQRTLCEWADCTDSMISKRLSVMEDADRIVRVPLGRTKLVCLPDSVPDMYGDPWDEP